MGYIDLKGAVITGNAGGGILQVGEGFVIEAEGAVIANNGGPGVIQRDATFLEQLGLPNETDPKELAELLRLLLVLPDDTRAAVVTKSNLFAQIKAFAIDGSTLANNIVSLIYHPGVQQIIQRLSA